MKDEYDLSRMKARKNPYARKLKQQLTLRLDPEVVAYFKALSDKKGIPYQTLINLYLRECMESGRELRMEWHP